MEDFHCIPGCEERPLYYHTVVVDNKEFEYKFCPKHHNRIVLRGPKLWCCNTPQCFNFPKKGNVYCTTCLFSSAISNQ